MSLITYNRRVFVSMVKVVLITLSVLSLGLVTADSGGSISVIPASVQWMGNIQSTRLDESSGLASSHYSAGVLWSINDSGSGPELFALTLNGQHLGSWLIDMPEPVDWEAMASFQWQDKGFLLVADIGDNFAARSSVSFTVIREPDLEQVAVGERLKPLFTRHFTFPGGARDAEAVAVDAVREEVLVLSKRTRPPELYRLPLSVKSPETSAHAPISGAAASMLEAELVAELAGFRKPSKDQADSYGSHWAYMGMPTGMSLSADRLLVTTLEHAYLFSRQNLSEPAKLIKLPFAGQREAIAFAKNSSNTAYVTHERKDGLRKAAIYRLQLEAEEGRN